MGVAQVEQDWLDLVADLLADPPATLPDGRIGPALCATFGLTACTYNEPSPTGWGLCRVWPAADDLDGLRRALSGWRAEHAPQEHPLLRYHLWTGRRVPIQTVDVPERVTAARLRDGWAEFGRTFGTEHQMALPLQLGPGRHRAFVMGRTERFDRHEVQLAELLWRLLTGVDRHVRTLARVGPHREAAADLRLTPREQAVLGLLVDGLTAGAIGRRLAVSERTVHKHLEHVYGKLGVADRLSAVLRAQDAGLLAR